MSLIYVFAASKLEGEPVAGLLSRPGRRLLFLFLLTPGERSLKGVQLRVAGSPQRAGALADARATDWHRRCQ